MTISEGLRTLKTLRDRYKELVGLRDANANKERRFYGSDAGREVVKDPRYDVVKLDADVRRVQLEEQRLDERIKAMNATTEIVGYVFDPHVLGEVTAAALPPKSA